MKEQPVIMVQVADPAWTWAALHAACALARNTGGCLMLVHTVCVKHPAYLGTEMGYLDLCDQDVRNLQAYADTAADYGVPCAVTVYQAVSRFGAIADAADQTGAGCVYARQPASRIPFWSACQYELLRVRLAHQNCALLDVPAGAASRRQCDENGVLLPQQHTNLA